MKKIKKVNLFKIRYMRVILFALLALLCISMVEGLVRQDAMGKWMVHIDTCPKKQLNGLDLETSMPTSIYLDLLRHQKIPDLFKGAVWESQRWVSECNLTYTKKITISQQLLQHQNVELVFEGIDTYSTIYFNDKKILSTENAFVEYRALLPKDIIKQNGENQIKIQMYSTSKFDQAANSANKMPFIYAHTRKACYQYSWDWAPFVNTVGVWKDIYFTAYDSVKIDYVWARNRQVNSDFAIINFATALKISNASALKDAYLEISEQHSTKGSQKIILDGSPHVYGDLKILNPRFWWPNGIGEPNIYQFKVSLTLNGKIVDQKKIIFGIRTVELDLSDSKFTVKVNGYPVYCKGANYVPPDMLYARLSNKDYSAGNSIENLLHDAVNSNYNMIRLWGGGQYQSNQLLELASRLGIMIFYDFMFSDSIYPSTEPFLRNVEVEVRQQVQRARNYPCLMLWSGNNQIYQGIKAWGWNSAKYRQDFKKLFEETIPKILEKQDPSTPYISSSPIYGIGNAGFNKGGDIHYWGVWAAGSNFQSYKNALGPFNSQFGTQALPVWQTIKYFAEKSEERDYSNSVMLSHERHSSKFNTLRKYIKTYAHQSKDMEHEAYLSGLVQAFGVQIAIISQRIAKPKSWGTLYWQFNDAWPGISWSSIDYFGRWKPLQYMAKRSYPNVAIFCQDGIITAINDNLYDLEAVTIVKVFNLSGTLMYNKTETIQLKQNQVKKLPDVKNFNGKDVIVYTEIIAGRNKEMWTTATFYPFKDLSLDPQAKLYVNYNTQYDIITLRTDKVIKNLFISHPDEYLKFSDNYFDLVPGKKYKVQLLPSHYGKQKRKISDLKNKMIYRSYVQIHSDKKLVVIQE